MTQRYATIKHLCNIANQNRETNPEHAADAVKDARDLGATRNDLANLLDPETATAVRDVELARFLKTGDPVSIGKGDRVWRFREAFRSGGHTRARLYRVEHHDDGPQVVTHSCRLHRLRIR